MTDEPDDIRKRLRAYLAASKEYEATFEQSPIADILAKDANGHYIVPVKDIVGRLFNDGQQVPHPFWRTFGQTATR